MPPKIRVTKEEIVKTAVDLVREQGESALNARTVAARLNCSTQPIFFNFESMGQLRNAVIEAAYAMYREHIRAEMESGEYPPYKASGMAYISFAQKEKLLFQLLFMRDRTAEEIPEKTEEEDEMAAMVQAFTGLSMEEARLFHMEMWFYVHGIATMVATNFLTPDRELISRVISDAYQGLKKNKT